MECNCAIALFIFGGDGMAGLWAIFNLVSLTRDIPTFLKVLLAMVSAGIFIAIPLVTISIFSYKFFGKIRYPLYMILSFTCNISLISLIWLATQDDPYFMSFIATVFGFGLFGILSINFLRKDYCQKTRSKLTCKIFWMCVALLLFFGWFCYLLNRWVEERKQRNQNRQRARLPPQQNRNQVNEFQVPENQVNAAQIDNQLSLSEESDGQPIEFDEREIERRLSVIRMSANQEDVKLQDVPKSNYNSYLYMKKFTKKIDTEKQACSVCLEDFKEESIVVVLKKCLHVYHEDCIKDWLRKNKRSCPMCRKTVVAPKKWLEERNQ